MDKKLTSLNVQRRSTYAQRKYKPDKLPLPIGQASTTDLPLGHAFGIDLFAYLH